MEKAFEQDINEYETARKAYQVSVIDRMDRKEYMKYNEVLFSTHSCAIEGNSFSVDDTRELKEKEKVPSKTRLVSMPCETSFKCQ